MPKKSTKPNRSDFVRSQPVDLSAAQVVAKAKEAGLTITPALVYTVRSSQKVKNGTAPRKSAPEAAPGEKAAGKKSTASDFIRSLATSVSATDAALLGARQGYSFQSGLVYKVRRTMGGHKAKAPKAAAVEAKAAAHPAHAPIAHPATHAASSNGSNGTLAEFRKLMIQIGLEQAEVLYNEVHRQLTAIAHKA